jgi:signal transduction histidine kinase
MSHGSLRLRLLAAALVFVSIALLVAGLAIGRLFQSEVEARVRRELDAHLLQLAGALRVDTSGKLSISHELADPRFGRPYSGLYWQVTTEDPKQILVSRSLWDGTLELDAHGRGLDPEDEPVMSSMRDVTLPAGARRIKVHLIAATREAEITFAVAAFQRSLVWSLALIGAALVVASWLQVIVGLGPLRALRTQLAAIRTGRAKNLSGEFPDEVAPLASEFNAVLDAQDASLVRARSRAGDLAHGLKTPLTVLSAIATGLAKSERREEAKEIAEQVDAMRRHVERQLARARLSAGRSVSGSDLHEASARIIGAMKRAPRGDLIAWQNNIAVGATVPMEREDLTELLGNLLDNARKWAKSVVRIAFAHGALSVEDDGPGVPDDQTQKVLERGIRLDESAQGSGLGLAIVRDIIELYGLALTLERSPLGGLEVKISFPQLKPSHHAA